MNNSLHWDLESILENSTLDELKDKYFQQNEEILNLFKENIFSSKEKLIFFHALSLRQQITSNRLFNYLSNKHNEDLSNNQWFGLMQEIQTKSIPFMQAMSSFSDQAIKNKENILEFLKDPQLAPHQRSYELIFKYEKHDLPPDIKSFSATYSPLSSCFSSIFTLILDKELKVKTVKDSNNNKHELPNYAAFIKTQTDNDRKLRKNAYLAWHEAVHSSRESLARLMYYNFLEQNIDAKNSNFPGGYYEASAYADEIPLTFIPALYERVKGFSTLWRKYRRIFRELLKKNYQLKLLQPWDLRMPIIKKEDQNITIEEAKTLTLEALQILGPEYINNISKALNERWIDWEARKDKLSGAYCISGSYGLEKKYILMNYNSKLEDVYTLVHELGHAMHALEYCKYQSHYAGTTIFIAEIPSTLNELLLSYHLIKKYQNDTHKLLEVYDNLISGFFSTTLSQIIFSEWEYEVNQLINNGAVLDADLAENIFREKQEKYYGKKPKLTPLRKKALTSILTVPHFYSEEFYVYKYSVGQVVSLLIAEKIKNDAEYISKFFEFLRAGNSLSNLDTIKILDIDLEKATTWKTVKKVVKEWLEEYEQLSKKI
ncbi:oligoendopeptidase F [Candidatus Mycoplasma haematobovis]|uniref:Oligoendopeptidase F n=1 Tax=Candidatus Mycoplasma haematobovis TaxID=432608 RepID=A0A1A9QF29_9MOLU|nr:M3 family oligoendopeptidase [Candidatus Mycoplasma haematobovis]OAL10300.1 oligoendopeptidase F [Candidatus Mycoplasma haematobovis]